MHGETLSMRESAGDKICIIGMYLMVFSYNNIRLSEI